MLRNLLALGLWLGVSSTAFAQHVSPPPNFSTLSQSMWTHDETLECQSDQCLLGRCSLGVPVEGMNNWYHGCTSCGRNGAAHQGLCEAFAPQHFKWPVPRMQVVTLCATNVNSTVPN